MRNVLLIALLGVVTYCAADWRVAAAVAIVGVLALRRSVVAASAAGAAAIHFAVAPEHYAEWWGYGTFFVVCAEVQLGWALTVTRRSSARLLWGGALASAFLIGLWAVTRTTGLPFGPEPGEAEAVGAADVATVALQLVTVAAVAIHYLKETSRMRITRKLTTAVAALVVTGVLVAGALAATPSATPMKMHASSAVTASDLRNTLDRLLGQHAVLAMNATNEGVTGNKAFGTTAKALDKNSVALSKAIGSIYGAKAGNVFLNGKFMWRAHIKFFVDYTVALAKNDKMGQNKAVANLKTYTVKFGDFLGGATGLPKTAVRSDLLGHVLELKNQLDAYHAGRYAKASEIYDAAYQHMFMTGDLLAGAIAKQKNFK